MALAANALVTLALVKSELGISGTEHDAFLERAINAASARIEGYCNRSFYNEPARIEFRKGYGDHLLRVEKTPLNSLTSIEFDGTTVASTLYKVESAGSGLIYKETGWNWTAKRVQVGVAADLIAGSEDPLYKVTYDAGYVTGPQGGVQTLPADLEEAALLLAVMRFRAMGRDPTVKSVKLLSYSVAYQGEHFGQFNPSGIPATIRGVLDQYARPPSAC